MNEKSIMNYGEEIISSKEEEEKDLDLPYDDLKIKYQNSEKLCRDLSEMIKNLEGKFNDTFKSLKETSRKFETCRNTVKKILSFYLEDEYFIDMIENCFKNQDFNIEETLATSKIIKTCVNVKSYNYILNEIIKPKLYYLKGLDIYNKIDLISDEFKSIDQFNHFNTNFSQDENNLVNKFISELLKKLDSKLNENFELNYQIKILNKELDESKKNEIESKETFNKQISILNLYSKLEKSLKNTIKSLESNLHNIEQNNDNLNKDYLILKENHYQLAIKKLDLEFEYIQVTIKLEENRSELKREKARNHSLKLENEELQNKVTRLENLRVIIDELNQQIIKKDTNYNALENLKNSLLENIKYLNKNLNNLNKENNDLFDKNQTIELSHDNQKKEYLNLNENHNQLVMKNKDLENEKNQLITDLEENRSEFKKEKARNDNLNLENKKLLYNVSNLEKLSIKLNQQIIKKKSEKEESIKNLKVLYNQFIDHYSENIEHLVDKKKVSHYLNNYLNKKNNDQKKKEALEELSKSLDLNENERKKIVSNNSNSNDNLKKGNNTYSSHKNNFI